MSNTRPQNDCAPEATQGTKAKSDSTLLNNNIHHSLANESSNVNHTKFKEFLSLFRNVRERTNGDYQVSCPGPIHERGDKNPSLSISQKGDKILIHCQVGCSADSILQAISLKKSDLFFSSVPESKSPSLEEQIVATYDYLDVSGKLLHQTVRFRSKRFRQRHMDEKGRWQWNLKGINLTLYRLPEIMNSDCEQTVFICEGEKDVDRLIELGLLATTNAMGSGKWREEYSEMLNGRHVVIVPDNDSPGRKHAQEVARSLNGKAASVKIIELPGLPEKGDLSDWIEAGGTQDELRRMVEDAIEFKPDTEPQSDADPISELCALPDSASIDEIGVVLEPLTSIAMPTKGRAIVREKLISELKRRGVNSPAGVTDAYLPRPVAKEKATGQGQEMTFDDPEPHGEPVDGAALLDEIKGTILRYASISDCEATATALFVQFTHTHDAAQHSPIDVVRSPLHSCGKTTLITILRYLVPRALMVANLTPATTYRVIEKYNPTLIVDEADAFLKDNEELRGILDSGHEREAAFILRSVGENHETRKFSTWCPKIIAMIGKPRPTIASRGINIEMVRLAPGEKVENLPVYEDRKTVFHPLNAKAAKWALDNIATLRRARPAMPVGLFSRAADNWSPLLAIADAVGGEWPEIARMAAQELSGKVEDESVGEMLIEDIAAILEQHEEEIITSLALVEALVEREHRPWGEWRSGKPITPNGLARQLSKFGIKPKQIWHEGEKVRGYERAMFRDTFTRYVPSHQISTGRPVGLSNGAGLLDFRPVETSSLIPDGKLRKPSNGAGSTVLPLEKPVPPEMKCIEAEKEALRKQIKAGLQGPRDAMSLGESPSLQGEDTSVTQCDGYDDKKRLLYYRPLLGGPSTLPEDQIEAFEEKLAIMVEDGNVTEEEAWKFIIRNNYHCLATNTITG